MKKLIILTLLMTGCVNRLVQWVPIDGVVLSSEIVIVGESRREYNFYATFKNTSRCILNILVDEMPHTSELPPAFCDTYSAGDTIEMIKFVITERNASGEHVRRFYEIETATRSVENMERMANAWGRP